MIDKNKLKRRFSRNAKTYDKYASVQKVMGKKLMDEIGKNNDESIDALEVGCGTGYVTEMLVERFDKLNLTAMDIAPGMIDYTSQKVALADVNFECGDIEEYELSGNYDLIVSNAACQWFNDLEKTLEKLMNKLSIGGEFIFTTFGSKTFVELDQAFKEASKNLEIEEAVAPSQNFKSIEELENSIKKIVSKSLGEFSVECFSENEREYFSNCLEFLQSVKKIGANNSSADRKITTPTFIDEVIKIYNYSFLEEEKVYATYNTIYFRIIRTN